MFFKEHIDFSSLKLFHKFRSSIVCGSLAGSGRPILTRGLHQYFISSFDVSVGDDAAEGLMRTRAIQRT